MDLTKLGVNFTDLLCYCSLKGALRLCQKLIQKNPETDQNGRNRENKTALNVSAEQEWFKVWNYLLDQGADINSPNDDGLTSLYFVSKSGRLDLVKKYVVEYNADVKAKGCSSVSLENKHIQISNFLLDQGAKVESDQDLSLLYNFCNEGLMDLTKLGYSFTDLLCHSRGEGE